MRKTPPKLSDAFMAWLDAQRGPIPECSVSKLTEAIAHLAVLLDMANENRMRLPGTEVEREIKLTREREYDRCADQILKLIARLRTERNEPAAVRDRLVLHLRFFGRMMWNLDAAHRLEQKKPHIGKRIGEPANAKKAAHAFVHEYIEGIVPPNIHEKLKANVQLVVDAFEAMQERKGKRTKSATEARNDLLRALGFGAASEAARKSNQRRRKS